MQLAFRIMGLAARLLLALGAVCLLLGLYLLSQTLEQTDGAMRATGVVVSYHENADGGDVYYRPRVRFTTPDGNIYTVASRLAAKSKRFPLGAQVPITYPPADPATARIATFTDNWLAPLICGLVGAVSFAAGFLVRRAVRREVSKASAPHAA